MDTIHRPWAIIARTAELKLSTENSSIYWELTRSIIADTNKTNGSSNEESENRKGHVHIQTMKLA